MEIPSTRDIHITGPIDDASATQAIAQLLFHQSQAPGVPVRLHLNTPGGAATAALAIMDTIRFVSTPVHTRGSVTTCGVALWLLAAGARGCRQ